MQLSTSHHQGTSVVTVKEDRIDAAVAIQFKDAMRSVTDGAGSHVVLDLTEVDFIDSSGLGAIVATMKQLGQDRRLDLAGLSPAVEKVFRLTRMDSIFALHDTVEHALSSAIEI